MVRCLSLVSTLVFTGVSSVRVAALLAALFGLVLIWGVGFAHPSAIHNAAHDARHAIAFPCH